MMSRWLLAPVLVTAPGFAAPPEYDLIELPSPMLWMHGNDHGTHHLNNMGQVVAAQGYWDPVSGFIPVPIRNARAHIINDAGVVAGQVPGGGLFFWDPVGGDHCVVPGSTDLSILVRDLNEKGQAVGVAVDDGIAHGFVADASGITVIDHPGRSNAAAVAINESGVVAALAADSLTPLAHAYGASCETFAFYWSGGVATLLTDETTFSTVADITASGRMPGSLDGVPTVFRPGFTPTEYFFLPGEAVPTVLTDVRDADGSAIGWTMSSWPDCGAPDGFRYWAFNFDLIGHTFPPPPLSNPPTSLQRNARDELLGEAPFPEFSYGYILHGLDGEIMRIVTLFPDLDVAVMTPGGLNDHGEIVGELIQDGKQIGTYYAWPDAADVDGDGSVGTDDLLAILGGWGPCPPPPARCTGDTNRDGVVDVTDMLRVLADWD